MALKSRTIISKVAHVTVPGGDCGSVCWSSFDSCTHAKSGRSVSNKTPGSPCPAGSLPSLLLASPAPRFQSLCAPLALTYPLAIPAEVTRGGLKRVRGRRADGHMDVFSQGLCLSSSLLHRRLYFDLLEENHGTLSLPCPW